MDEGYCSSDEWLQVYAAPNLARSTLESYAITWIATSCRASVASSCAS